MVRGCQASLARAFGTAPRTWLRDLRFTLRDYFIIGLGVAILATTFTLSFGLGLGGFWMPEFMYHLASG